MGTVTLSTVGGNKDFGVETFSAVNYEIGYFTKARPTTTSAAASLGTFNTTTALTYSPPAGTTHVLVSLEIGDIRYTEDGTAPTSTVGHFRSAPWVEELVIPVGGALKFIQDSGSSNQAILFISGRKYV